MRNIKADKKLIYQEKYRKGTFVDKRQILKLITDNIDKLSIEAREKQYQLTKVKA